MSAWLLAALLRRALPGLAVLDLLPAGGLYPWWPRARLALDPAVPLAPAERALLDWFGLPGIDPALSAGAPEAWDGEGPRLVSTRAEDAGTWIDGGALVLARLAEPPLQPRVMLLLGLGGVVAQHDLLLPEGALEAVLAALAGAAEAMAGSGWDWGVRAVSPRLGTLTLFAPAGAVAVPRLDSAGLVQRREGPGRLRVLLGALPARPLRLEVALEGGPAALFLDGAPYAPGDAFRPSEGLPVVLGIAGEGVALRSVEITPA